MQKTKLKNAGFTIIELLIAIVIIGILATIGFLSYRNAKGKSQAAVTESMVVQYSRAIRAFAIEHDGDYPNYSLLPPDAQASLGPDADANAFCIGGGYRSDCGTSNAPKKEIPEFVELLRPYAGEPQNIAPHDTPLTVDPGSGFAITITGVAYYYNTPPETPYPEADSLDGRSDISFAFMVYALDKPDAECTGGATLSLASMNGYFVRNGARNTLTDGKNTACVVLFEDSVGA